jgi:hypothetical protein
MLARDALGFGFRPGAEQSTGNDRQQAPNTRTSNRTPPQNTRIRRHLPCLTKASPASASPCLLPSGTGPILSHARQNKAKITRCESGGGEQCDQVSRNVLSERSVLKKLDSFFWGGSEFSEGVLLRPAAQSSSTCGRKASRASRARVAYA